MCHFVDHGSEPLKGTAFEIRQEGFSHSLELFVKGYLRFGSTLKLSVRDDLKVFLSLEDQ